MSTNPAYITLDFTSATVSQRVKRIGSPVPHDVALRAQVDDAVVGRNGGLDNVAVMDLDHRVR
jgi:hypothetical protein